MAKSATSAVQAIEIARGRRVAIAPAAVWSVLGDFGAEHRWASQLKHCRRDTEVVGVGSVRRCVLAKPLMGRTTVEEELIDYDPGRTLAYELRGGAGPFRSAEGRWTVRPDGSGAYIEISGRFRPRNALIGLLLGRIARFSAERAAQRALDDLALFLRTHRP